MTDRIRAVLEAADKATPGPWDAVHVNDKGLWCICKAVNGVVISPSTDNASLIAAAPDMAAEIVKLRKWQSEALPYIEERYGIDLNQIEALEMEVPEWETSPGYRAVMNGCKERVPQLDRLIAEAKEATND